MGKSYLVDPADEGFYVIFFQGDTLMEEKFCFSREEAEELGTKFLEDKSYNE